MSVYGVLNLTNTSSKKFIHEFDTGVFQPNGRTETFEIIIEAGETTSLPAAAATDAAYYLSQIIMEEKGDHPDYNVYTMEGALNPNSRQAKVMMELLGQIKVDYSPYTKRELIEHGEKKGIKLDDTMKRDEMINRLTNA